MRLSQVNISYILVEYGQSRIITDYSNTWYEGKLDELARDVLDSNLENKISFTSLTELIKLTSGLPN